MRTKRNRCVSVEHIVNAPPEAVFAVLSNPRQHSSIDGSRTLLGRDCENVASDRVERSVRTTRGAGGQGG
jgi:hypothetical protein